MSLEKNRTGSKDPINAYASYSEHYFSGQRLTSQTVRKIFENEVQEVSKNAFYIGLWQLAGLPNILLRHVASVCPTYGTHTVRDDINRDFLSIFEASEKKRTLYGPIGKEQVYQNRTLS